MGGAGFLHQHVLMEQLHSFGPHQPGGHVGDARPEGEAFELGDPGPVAVVVPESAGVVGGAVVVEEFAGLGLVASHAGGQLIDPVGEQATEVHGTVGGEGIGLVDAGTMEVIGHGGSVGVRLGPSLGDGAQGDPPGT